MLIIEAVGSLASARPTRMNDQPKPTGRVGEMFARGAPNPSGEDMPELVELHARCGPGTVVNVGNPESKAAFDLRYSQR